MKISVTRSGGFAGLTENLGTVDTTSLAPTLAGEAERLVRESRFFELPAEMKGEVGADFFRYEVKVEVGPKAHSVAYFDNEQQCHVLSGLVEWVTKTARR